jgi:hypothetical protein
MRKRTRGITYQILWFAVMMVAAVECQTIPLALNDTQAIYTPGPSMFILEDSAMPLHSWINPQASLQSGVLMMGRTGHSA